MADLFTPLDAILKDGPFSIATKQTIEIYGQILSTNGTISGTISRESGELVLKFNDPKPALHGPLGAKVYPDKITLPPSNQMLAEGTGPLGFPVKKILRIDELEA